MILTGNDIAAIERATVAAVTPLHVAEFGGWLVPYDPGTVGRAKSAVPLSHRRPREEEIARIERWYANLRAAPALRLPVLPAFADFTAALARRGYARGKPTLVLTAATADVAGSAPTGAEVAAHADDAWAAVFLGEGFDPADGASRVATLRRNPASLFGAVRGPQGRPVAVGVLALSHGWASLHGLRTAQSERGRGHGARIVATLAGQARDRGFARMVLQVEEGNETARRLYARMGFRPAWAYEYWMRQSDPS